MARQQPSGAGVVPPPQLAAAKTTPAETQEARPVRASQPRLTRVRWPLAAAAFPPSGGYGGQRGIGLQQGRHTATACCRYGDFRRPTRPLKWGRACRRVYTHTVAISEKGRSDRNMAIGESTIFLCGRSRHTNGCVVQRALRSCKISDYK